MSERRDSRFICFFNSVLDCFSCLSSIRQPHSNLMGQDRGTPVVVVTKLEGNDVRMMFFGGDF